MWISDIVAITAVRDSSFFHNQYIKLGASVATSCCGGGFLLMINELVIND